VCGRDLRSLSGTPDGVHNMCVDLRRWILLLGHVHGHHNPLMHSLCPGDVLLI
jgi:hypothetical protein